MMLQSAIRGLLGRFGLDLVRRENLADRALSVALREALAGVPLVFDVGANIGQFRDYLRGQVGFAGRIVSFEPNPADFAVIEERAKADPLWDVWQLGLGAEDGQLTLNVTKGSDFSSFLTPRHDRISFHGNQVERRVEVPVRRLDAWLAEQGIDPAGSFLKSDTQGFDLQVMRGAAGALPGMVGLLTEVSAVPAYEGCPDYLEALAELRGYGFELSFLKPMWAEKGIVIEFDCLMRRAVS